MTDALDHRGPDDAGVFAAGPAGLGHTRLSIIDPAGGAQPMRLPDRDLALVFNGEIYNYVELREELVKLGHEFRTRSDTEVVLRALAEWGDDALVRFNGQWAIALWDGQRRRLLLSRDRVGIHPLYYAESRDRIVFASEVKAIFAADPALRQGLDPVGLDQTFTFWAAVAPRTVFRGISELPPGHVRVYEDGVATERAYFEHDFTKRFRGSIADAEEAVREALERATALRMLRADVPVGCTSRAGSTARSSPRSGCARRARSSTRSRFASPTRSSTRPSSNSSSRGRSGRSITRSSSAATTSRASSPRSCAMPSGRSCGRRRRRCSCSRSSSPISA